jgi:uncharacterized cupin superfamily protein
VREGDGDQGFGWAQRESFENMHDLLGDLLGAKNAGVTWLEQERGQWSKSHNPAKVGENSPTLELL